MSAAVVFILFVICLVIAIPVSISLGIVAVLPGAFDSSFTASASYVIRSMLGGIDSFPLLAVPMFVLAGIVMAHGKISQKLFDVFVYFIGKRTAGIPCAVIITCLFYGAISGSAPATVAAVGSMTIPLLMELGYKKDFSTAIVAVAGGLGVIIPPSIPFIMYAMATGESVSDLFLAGIIPGLLIGALLMFYAYYHCKRYGEDKEKINAKVSELRSKGLFSILKDSIWALLSPVIVLGCIYAGIASPTEAAVISVFYALFVSLFIYKSIKVKEIWGIMVEAMKTYAPILFILAASTAFSRVLTLMQVPQTVSAWILAHFTNEIVLLIVINVFLLIVGMVYGYHTGYPYFKPNPASYRAEHWNEPDPLWCGHDRKPCNRICHTAYRSKPVCGKLTDGCSGHADSKEGGTYDRIFPAGTSAAYIYSGNQSVLIIEK